MKPLLFENGNAPENILPTLETVANQLQVLLMPIAYQINHPEIIPDMTDAEVRRSVAMEWMQQYAGPFREYIESTEHRGETINLADPEAPKTFFDRFRSSETIH